LDLRWSYAFVEDVLNGRVVPTFFKQREAPWHLMQQHPQLRGTAPTWKRGVKRCAPRPDSAHPWNRACLLPESPPRRDRRPKRCARVRPRRDSITICQNRHAHAGMPLSTWGRNAQCDVAEATPTDGYGRRTEAGSECTRIRSGASSRTRSRPLQWSIIVRLGRAQ
jgi:hypothetical protein